MIPCPFFSTIVLSKNRIRFPWVSGGFLERMIPGKNGEGTLDFWVNFHTTSHDPIHSKWWFMLGIAPQPPYFRLVKYYNSPRSFGFLRADPPWRHGDGCLSVADHRAFLHRNCAIVVVAVVVIVVVMVVLVVMAAMVVLVVWLYGCCALAAQEDMHEPQLWSVSLCLATLHATSRSVGFSCQRLACRLRWLRLSKPMVPFWVGEFTTHFRLPILVVGLGPVLWGLTGILTHGQMISVQQRWIRSSPQGSTVLVPSALQPSASKVCPEYAQTAGGMGWSRNLLRCIFS